MSAGVVLAVLTGSGAFARAVVTPQLLPGLAAGTVVLPALAVFLGTLSGSQRPFQVACLLLWYLGPLHGIPVFDLTGATGTASPAATPWSYLASGGILLAAAALIRLFRGRPLQYTPRRSTPVANRNTTTLR